MGWSWHFNWLIHISWALSICLRLAKWQNWWVRMQKPSFKKKMKYMKWKTKMKMVEWKSLRYLSFLATMCLKSRLWDNTQQGSTRAMVHMATERNGTMRTDRQLSCPFPLIATSYLRRKHCIVSIFFAGKQINQLESINCLLCILFSRYRKMRMQRNR